MTARTSLFGLAAGKQAATARPTIGRRRDVVVGLGVCLAVVALAAIPLAWNRIFYYWNDSATEFLPMWHHLGTVIAHGGWPPLLDVNAWMGGNIAAEALYGIYNPINIANYLMVAALPDLAIAAFLVKAEFMAILALGVYLLCREYRAAPWASAALAIAVPFAGFTLYFDTAVWASGLMAFAYVPHLWWTARRAARRTINPLWPILVGALEVTTGNPYGVLGICVVLLALITEAALQRHWHQAILILLIGLCIGALIPIIYLPLLSNASIGTRPQARITNDGDMRPGITDLISMSAAGYIPRIQNFGKATLHVPATYFAWFVIPLLPWLRWRSLREQWRAWIGVLAFTGTFLVLTLGPSNLWMFRWPLRLIEYFYLGVAVVFALLLSHGFARDHWRRRAILTAAVLIFGTYLSVAVNPTQRRLALIALVVTAVLSAVALAIHHRTGTPRWLATVLSIGTASVLALQTWAIPANLDLRPWNFPHSISTLQRRFADRYTGTTMQFASVRFPPRGEGLRADGVYRDFLFGSAYLPAGVRSVNSYTGMGFKKFAQTFCMTFNAQVRCPEGYRALWRPTAAGGRPLADLMKLDTLVVQASLVPHVQPPPGWHTTERTPTVTVLHRNTPNPWPAGRLAWASPGLTVHTDDSPGDRRETVRLTQQPGTSGRQKLVFARLNWPGYQATINDRPAPITTGPAGLTVVHIPADMRSGTLSLTWTPRGYTTGIAGALVALVGSLALSIGELYRKRQRRRARHPAQTTG